jgi:uncharacterized membrane protein
LKKILLFFCSFIFVFLIKTNSVNAFFVIDDYNMDCTVLENGDMYVKETLEYSTDEYRNGVYRDIITINPDNKTNSASSLELYKVYVNGTQYNLSKTANNGDTGIFLYTKTDTNTYRIKVYTPFDYQGKIIQYEYKLTNVAVKYNDTAELFWNFVGKGWQDQINQLTVNILLPIDSTNNKIYVFGHGSDNGTFTKRENNITLKASNIKPGQAIDARILFSRDAINKSKKIQDKNVLEKYINTEEKMYKNKPFNIFAGVNLLAMSLSIIVILAWIIIYLKFDKEEKGIKYKYFREIPLNMNPEIIEYLYKRKASSKTVWVTFLSLIKKGFFKIEKGTNAIGGETYNICYIEKNKNGLLPYEANFISWITSYFDNNNEQNQKTVSLLNLKNNIKNDKGSYSSFNSFEEDIKKEATTSFGEWLEIPTPVKIGCIILMAILIIIITISAITAGHKDMVLMVTIFLILTTAVYSIFFTTLPFTVTVISFFSVHF